MKNLKSISKKIAITSFVFLIAGSIGLSPVSAASNYTDTIFEFHYNGDGGDRTTDKREKRDYSSSYVYNKWSTYGFAAKVLGSKYYSSNGVGSYCVAGPIPHVGVGEAKYLPNYVKERGYNYAQIQMMSDSHSSSYMGGLWSPDSI